MMRYLKFVVVAATAIIGSSAASAADLPAKAIFKPAAYNWTGCYLGVHGGGGILYAGWNGLSDGGGLAGGQAGCNYQTGQLVVGVEAEGWWSGLTSRDANSGAGFSFASTSRNRWDADLALRAGVAVDRALVYGKVGAAWGRFDLSADASSGLFERGSGTLSGPLFGGGIEYAFGSNWTAKLEYDYIGYLSRSLHIDAGPAAIQLPFDTSVSAGKHIVKLGLNYKFGDPVATPAVAATYSGPIYKAPPRSALYNWTGCYVGVHAGGGTLNDHWIGAIDGGGLAGGQLGCNYQSGAAVVGIEGEGFWSSLASTASRSQPGFSESFSGRNRWDVDVALRAGVAIDRALIYHKVGVVRGSFDRSFIESDGGFERSRGSATGLLLGTGFEYALAGNWTAKLEYDYIGYLGSDFPTDSGGAPGFVSGVRTHSATAQIAKAGVNYKLGDAVATAGAAPLALPPAAYDWTSCYVGVHAGGGVLFDFDTGRNGGGGIAGGQAGCNYQAGQIVLGVEAEGAWADLNSREMIDRPGFRREERTRNSGDADVSLRAGLAVDRALAYGKVGAAWGQFTYDTSPALAHASGTLTGLLLGTGVEYALADNWSVKLEYDYIGFTPRSMHFVSAAPPVDQTISDTKQIAKLGVNYRFGGPQAIVAKY
jgi:outer membrane immunogenic protein